MANILYRASTTPSVPSSTSAKGTGLTNLEIDGNLKSLNDSKLEISEAVSTNTANKVVKRDDSGDFAAGTITATLSGNASTATRLQTARTINGVSFNGTANITVTANTTNALTIGSYLNGGSFNGSGSVTISVNADSDNTPSTVVARDASGNFVANNITGNLIGNATTATVFETSRTINGVAFNGSSNITITASTPNTLTRGTYLTGSNFNGSSATTWAVDASSSNIASKIVARDSSGNFAAGTITATLSGNASTATSLQTARTINGVSFNGTANITVTANTTNSISAGAYIVGSSFNGSTARTWNVDATDDNIASKIVQRDVNGDFSAGTITADLNGNAATATQLATARTINGVSFNGTANINVNTNAYITPGTYLTGSAFNGSTARTWAVDATSANTASKVVARDASGNFSAGVVTVTDLNTTSDRNLKTNIQNIENPLDVVNQIQGVSFDFISNGEHSYGVIAQELEKVLPSLVHENEEGYKVVSYIPLIAFLIESIKDQQKQIDDLKSRVL